MRDMASMVTPINRVWVWIHLTNMFNFKIHILLPSHSMVAYLDPDESVHGPTNQTVYFVVQKQKYYAVLPDTSPIRALPGRHVTNVLTDAEKGHKEGKGLPQPLPTPSRGDSSALTCPLPHTTPLVEIGAQTVGEPTLIPSVIGTIPVPMEVSVPSETTLQALYAKVADMQAMIMALTQVVTAQSAAKISWPWRSLLRPNSHRRSRSQ